MKLWQKIFLSSLALIIAVVNIVSLTLLENSHRLLIEREQTHAVNEHEYFSSALINAVIYERLAGNMIAVSSSDIKRIAGSMVSSGSRTFGTAVYSDSYTISASDLTAAVDMELHKGFLESIDTSGNEFTSAVIDTDGKKLLAIGSAIKLEGGSYYVVTLTDISGIYTMRERQSDSVRKISIIASAVISLILLIMTMLLLRPLNQLNTYTKAIAGGRYDIRIRKKGSREFRELADNMNKMADAVEKHALHLERVAESRRSFIADLAHEMKTPLTSILGFGDLLRIKKNVSDSERIEYAAVIVDETKRLRSLSGKLMELVALGGTEIEKRPVSLPKLIKDAEAALDPILKKGDVRISSEADDMIINADEELFKSLMYNIIENAVKASPKGSEIRISAKHDNEAAVISVADNGIGMTNEEAERVFEPFYMADKSRSRKAGGAGLGLALCEKIAKLHNTALSIESEPGSGTTVYIRIPGSEIIEA